MSHHTVDNYDREYTNDSESSIDDNGCEGCYLLNRGMGGENQLAHMQPGGCLYESLDEYESQNEHQNTINQNHPLNVNDLNIKQKLVCIVCKHDKICEKKELKMESYICSSCEFMSDRLREIKYQSFTFTGYK
jgi:hypothetical protein